MINAYEFDLKCNAIAKHLGGTFHINSTMASWIFQGEIVLPGCAITVRCEEKIGKLNFSGVWPSNQKNEVYFPRSYDKSSYSAITCSASRNAAVIAKDIQRRFLPAYLLELGVQKVRCQASNDYVNLTVRNVANLVAVSGGKSYEHRPNEISLSSDRSDIFGTVKVSGDSINIDLHSLSPAQAYAVLEIVRAL